MGYTHYWSQNHDVTEADWTEFSEGAARLVALVKASGVALKDGGGERGKPVINADEVAFNGAGEEAYETFRIERIIDEEDGSWFCKTARMPYDTAVAAVLVYLDSVLPDTFEARSDGSLENFRDALELAKQAWPSKANILDFPRSLRDEARFMRFEDGSERYQVVIGHDDVTYIEDLKTRALRRLPDDMQGKAFSVWAQNVPHNMRRWGSFGPGEHASTENKRLKKVWTLSSDNPVPPVPYCPITHGLKRPEITSAHQW